MAWVQVKTSADDDWRKDAGPMSEEDAVKAATLYAKMWPNVYRRAVDDFGAPIFVHIPKGNQ